jgi:hypothetical protein
LLPYWRNEKLDMCFSPEVSFGASAIIGAIGIVTIKSIQSRRLVVFASIPMIFAVHQFSEGFVWLSLLYPSFAALEGLSVGFYMVMAQVLWPFWVPLSILLLEKQAFRRKILKSLLVLGVLGSAYLAYSLLLFDLKAEIIGHHIKFKQGYAIHFPAFGFIFYFIPTVFSLFVSSIKNIRILGTAILVSAIVSMLFFRIYFTSVWCFFAALISIGIYFIVRDLKKNHL